MPNFVQKISMGFKSELNLNVSEKLIYSIFIAYIIYALITAIWGLFLLKIHHDIKKERCFYGLLKNPKPRIPIQNPLEEYSLLSLAFYEVRHILENNKKSLKALDKNKDFIPQTKQDNDYNHAQYLNSLEGMYHLNLETEDYQNNAYEIRSKAVACLALPLEESWGITDQESALNTIENLWQNAQNMQNLLEIPKYKPYCELIEDLGLQKPQLKHGEFISNSGFNIVRTIWVARSAFTIGYITEEQLRNILQNTALFLIENYETWHELAYSYLCTFSEWGINESGFYNEICKRVHGAICLLNDENSPLHNKPLKNLKAYIEKIHSITQNTANIS